MVRYFSPCVHLQLTFSESFWKQEAEMDSETLYSRDIFPIIQGDYLFRCVLH